jgi:hypothetical protein
LNLEQRCLLIQRDFHLKLSLKGLYNFYKRNNVRYLTVSYIYQQAVARNPAAVENFAVALAKVIASG